jgi:hypothetical protein
LFEKAKFIQDGDASILGKVSKIILNKFGIFTELWKKDVG